MKQLIPLLAIVWFLIPQPLLGFAVLDLSIIQKLDDTSIIDSIILAKNNQQLERELQKAEDKKVQDTINRRLQLCREDLATAEKNKNPPAISAARSRLGLVSKEMDKYFEEIKALHDFSYNSRMVGLKNGLAQTREDNQAKGLWQRSSKLLNQAALNKLEIKNMNSVISDLEKGKSSSDNTMAKPDTAFEITAEMPLADRQSDKIKNRLLQIEKLDDCQQLLKKRFDELLKADLNDPNSNFDKILLMQTDLSFLKVAQAFLRYHDKFQDYKPENIDKIKADLGAVADKLPKEKMEDLAKFFEHINKRDQHQNTALPDFEKTMEVLKILTASETNPLFKINETDKYIIGNLATYFDGKDKVKPDYIYDALLKRISDVFKGKKNLEKDAEKNASKLEAKNKIYAEAKTAFLANCQKELGVVLATQQECSDKFVALKQKLSTCETGECDTREYLAQITGDDNIKTTKSELEAILAYIDTMRLKEDIPTFFTEEQKQAVKDKKQKATKESVATPSSNTSENITVTEAPKTNPVITAVPQPVLDFKLTATPPTEAQKAELPTYQPDNKLSADTIRLEPNPSQSSVAPVTTTASTPGPAQITMAAPPPPKNNSTMPAPTLDEQALKDKPLLQNILSTPKAAIAPSKKNEGRTPAIVPAETTPPIETKKVEDKNNEIQAPAVSPPLTLKLPVEPPRTSIEKSKGENTSTITTDKTAPPKNPTLPTNQAPKIVYKSPLLPADLQKSCTEFINIDGSYGKFGNIIHEYLKSKPKSYLLSAAPRPEVCPNWTNLTTEQKTNFWIWTFAAIAFDESTCGTDENSMIGGYLKGQNRQAVGLMQMERYLSQEEFKEAKRKSLPWHVTDTKGRYNPHKIGAKTRDWRGGACTQSTNFITNHKANIECSLHIMEDILAQNRSYKGNQQIFNNSGSYWEKLKPIKTDDSEEKKSRKRQIQKNIKSFPLCK